MKTSDKRGILGAVLAGGRSRRFGSDKACALLHGTPLIQHAADALTRHASQVVICGREHSPYLMLPDRPAPDMGPLGGLNAGLHFAATNGFGGLLCTGCDMPVFPDAVADALIGKEAAIVEGQYLMSYWPAGLSSILEEHLATSEDRSMRAWLAVARPRRIVAAEFPNINTPEDLRRFEAEGGGEP